MKDDFIAIYDNEAITRRAILSRSRKNAKTMEAACILLLHLCGIEAAIRPNSQIFSTALSRDQAALVFNLAVKMVRMNPRLIRGTSWCARPPRCWSAPSWAPRTGHCRLMLAPTSACRLRW